MVLNLAFIVCDEIAWRAGCVGAGGNSEAAADIRAERDLTPLFITHNIGVVEYLCDQTVVMYKGRIVEQGLTAQVCGDPQHEYTQKLLGAVPRSSASRLPESGGGWFARGMPGCWQVFLHQAGHVLIEPSADRGIMMARNNSSTLDR
ncbi:MAG: hypothetical protein R3E89_04260 [Thiolinea sp.]